MELDEAFRYLGKWGRHQTFMFIFINIFGSIIPGWMTMSVVFFTADPKNYYCTPPEGFFLNETVPGMVDGDGEDDVDHCHMYEVNENMMLTRNKTKCQNGWSYESTLPGESTLITDLDLVCDQSILAEVAASLFMGGVLIAAVPCGQIPDIIGRKPVFFACLIVEVLVGVALVFAWNYYIIVILWVLAGMFRDVGISAMIGVFEPGFVLVMEMQLPEQRAFVGSLMNILWGLSMTTLAGIAYILPNWRHMQLFMSLSLLFALPFYRIVTESERWLLAQGRKEEAEKSLQFRAKFNGIQNPPKYFLRDDDNEYEQMNGIKDEDNNGWNSNGTEETKGGYEKLHGEPKNSNGLEIDDDKKKYKMFEENEAQTKPKQRTFIDVFKTTALLKILLILYINCFANSLVYYGLSLDSSNISGNKYLNFFLLGIVEIPAYILSYYTMDRFGRRMSMVVPLIIAGVACIMTGCIPEETSTGVSLRPMIIGCAMLGKFMITYSFGVQFVYTPEMMPTVVRNVGQGLMSFALRVGGVLAPYVIYLDRISEYLPMNILGVICIVAGLLSIRLPETRNRPLPETLEDGVRLYASKNVPENMKSVDGQMPAKV